MSWEHNLLKNSDIWYRKGVKGQTHISLLFNFVKDQPNMWCILWKKCQWCRHWGWIWITFSKVEPKSSLLPLINKLSVNIPDWQILRKKHPWSIPMQNFKKKIRRKGRERKQRKEVEKVKKEAKEEEDRHKATATWYLQLSIDIKPQPPDIYLPRANLTVSQRIYFKLLTIARGHNKHFEYKLCLHWVLLV